MTVAHVSDVRLILADRLFDGRGGVLDDAGVAISGERIVAVGTRADLIAQHRAGVVTAEFPGGTLLPGLIDTHTHLIMPGTGVAILDYAALPDELLLLTAAANARRALRAGVTTLVDLGAKGQLTFRLREAISRGIVEGPRLVLSGRALTITGGHAWPWLGEADGPDGVRQAVRTLCKEGADLIKVMVTGGGTPGTNGRRPSYTQAELDAIVDEAHARERRVWGHCTATAGIERALSAGFDVIAHCQFFEPDGTLAFDERLAHRIADQGVYVNPTLQINRILLSDRVPAERRPGLAAWTSHYPDFARNVVKLRDLGVRLICGSDCGWGYLTFDEGWLELEALVAAGLTPLEALTSATGTAADALGLGAETGSLCPGHAADLLVVAGDPTADIGAMRAVRAVWRGGTRVDLPAGRSSTHPDPLAGIGAGRSNCGDR
jgi:imidazolonepropionase-like amidohydrolase